MSVISGLGQIPHLVTQTTRALETLGLALHGADNALSALKSHFNGFQQNHPELAGSLQQACTQLGSAFTSLIAAGKQRLNLQGLNLTQQPAPSRVH